MGFALACALALGCNKKGDECGALLGALDRAGDASKRVASAAPDASSADLAKGARAGADAAEAGGRDVAALTLTVAELKKFAADYQASAKDVAAADRDVAATLDRAEALMAKTHATVADDAIHAMQAAAEKIAKRCTDHAPPECKALGDQMGRLEGAAEHPDQLDQFVVDLGKLAVSDTTLAAQVNELREALRRAAKLLRDTQNAAKELEPLKAKLTAAQTTRDAATARSAATTAAARSFCGR